MQRAVVPWPQPLTQNQVRRLHHYTEAATKKRMHLQARAAYRAARLTPVTEPVHVTLTFQPADRRRRDTDGLAPTLKVAFRRARHRAGARRRQLHARARRDPTDHATDTR